MKTLKDCSVLIVDDAEANIDILVETLGDKYDISVALDGPTALEMVAESHPDIILLDIMMPGMDGYEVCERLKHDYDTRDIPVIFLTALLDLESKTKGFEMGAVDYVTKPFEPLEVRARVKTHLSLLLASQELKEQNEALEYRVRQRTKELVRTQEVTIESLAALAEYRDPETGGHIRRTSLYVQALAGKLKYHPKFAHQLDEQIITQLVMSAPLHDLGKVGIPDDILLKPGKLTDREMEIMKKHVQLGYEAIRASEVRLGKDSFLRYAREIVLTHHEKWDGTGYPNGLKGEDIPLAGRLMAVADVYDALISRRVYKPPFAHSKAVAIIQEGRGTHFDPEIVDVFTRIHKEFKMIALRYADYDEERETLNK